MTMIEKNIFRPLPNVKKQNLAFSETGVEAEDEVDPARPHASSSSKDQDAQLSKDHGQKRNRQPLWS